MTRLSELSAAQIRMLIKLDDKFDHEDSVGREIGEMSYHERRTADSLVKLGLVELTRGRDLRFWFRLTEKGRDLYPVIAHLAQWGDKYLAGDAGPPLVRVHRQCGEPLEAKLQCGHCGDSVEPKDIRLEENPHWAGQLLPTQAG